LLLELLPGILGHPLSIVIISVFISSVLSFFISLRLQSRELRYEMIKDHFNDLKEHAIKPWLQITEKMTGEFPRAREVSSPIFDTCLGALCRGEPPSDYTLRVKPDEFLHRDLMENHYRELTEMWRSLLKTYRERREIMQSIIQGARSAAEDEVRRLGIDWFKVGDYEEFLAEVVIDYSDKLGDLTSVVEEPVVVAGEMRYPARILPIGCSLAGGQNQDEAREIGERGLNLFKAVASRSELSQLRVRFKVVDEQLRIRLEDIKGELRRLLYKKKLVGTCDCLETSSSSRESKISLPSSSEDGNSC